MKIAADRMMIETDQFFGQRVRRAILNMPMDLNSCDFLFPDHMFVVCFISMKSIITLLQLSVKND